ncbi:MAG: uracil-DNA glycosylase [Planctomycetes bacterium]|nr:uracil-DNA glycosylase [Planctomycetota bacterium]
MTPPTPAPRRPAPAPAPTAQSASTPKPPSTPVQDLPSLPEGLDALFDLVATCKRCRLHEGRTHVVFGEGDPRARVVFVGEAPGAREDETGRPFVGAAGQLLTKIIENAMGLTRAAVYIANVNKCRPPNNRNPEPDEVAACLPYLRQQIRAIRPQVIVALGRVAAHNLLGTSLPMGQLRGRDLEYEGIPVVATWHPAYLLRQPEAKRETWEDIKRVNRLLGLPDVPPAGRATR